MKNYAWVNNPYAHPEFLPVWETTEAGKHPQTNTATATDKLICGRKLVILAGRQNVVLRCEATNIGRMFLVN